MPDTKIPESILDSDLEPSPSELDEIEREDSWLDEDYELTYWQDDYDYEEFD